MKAAARTIFSWIAYHTGLWRLLIWLISRIEGKPLLAVFMYHRVVRDSNNPNYLQGYERGLEYKDYIRQIDEIERYFTIITIEEFSDIVTGKVKPHGHRPRVLLTYDDGDSENLTLAFPILFERNMPALTFIPTAFIDSPKRFYHLRVTNALNNFVGSEWEQAAACPMPVDVRSVFARYAPVYAPFKINIRHQLIAPMERMLPEERDRLITQWEHIAGNTYTLGISPMTWNEIGSLPDRGIAVGSHTVNHNRFILLGQDEIRHELVESRRVLEEKLGRPVTTICYPEGSMTDDTPRLAREAGYQLGFSTEKSMVDYPLSGDDLLRIGRIGAGRGKSYEVFLPIGRELVKRLLRGSSSKP